MGGKKPTKKPASFWIARILWVGAGLLFIPLLISGSGFDPKGFGSLIFAIIILGLTGWVIDQN